MTEPFDSIYNHGFIRTAVCIPSVKVADPRFNTERIVHLAGKASRLHAAVALFPELAVSAYSNDDLFHQDALLAASLESVSHVVEESRSLTPLILVGAPLRFDGRLFNCAVAVYRGRVLGIVPKAYLPNYREYYEKRYFSAAREALSSEVPFLGQTVPFGTDLVFQAMNVDGFLLYVEICEDLWVPIPPSTYGALAGATVIANLSASNITVGKSENRRHLCLSQSARCLAGYLYSAAGLGESTTDLAWDGYALIYENGELLAESGRFSSQEQVIVGDIDLDRLIQERMRSSSFGDSIVDAGGRLREFRRVDFSFEVPTSPVPLVRKVERFPYVPSETMACDERCYEVHNIQVHGLTKRLMATGIEKVVIGVSGGLDSTHALIVCAKTMDLLGRPRKNILAYTMPGFATSHRTKASAHRLMEAMGVTAEELDIRPACLQMMKDIGHPCSRGEQTFDVTFENIQAGERTSHLFRLANLHEALVVGTGDLSELALGWATYGVGDHMSHYNVNASVPKTLIQHLIRWVIRTDQLGSNAGAVLQAVLDTEISPELVPALDEQPTAVQSTQASVGPYELQDFNLYYTTRYGFRPSKIAFLALHAWADRESGPWLSLIPPHRRNEYDLAAIVRWLEVFLYRFFKTSQFKRSAVPNGPKVDCGGSLSPRGDWRAPSDSEAVVWLDEIHRNAITANIVDTHHSMVGTHG